MLTSSNDYLILNRGWEYEVVFAFKQGCSQPELCKVNNNCSHNFYQIFPGQYDTSLSPQHISGLDTCTSSFPLVSITKPHKQSFLHPWHAHQVTSKVTHFSNVSEVSESQRCLNLGRQGLSWWACLRLSYPLIYYSFWRILSWYWVCLDKFIMGQVISGACIIQFYLLSRVATVHSVSWTNSTSVESAQNIVYNSSFLSTAELEADSTSLPTWAHCSSIFLSWACSSTCRKTR